jgi:hypothetical protein
MEGPMAARTLRYFPIIHSQPDMGALSESIRKVTLQKLGERVWRRKLQLVERFWSQVRESLQAVPLDYKRTRVYQDGLPVCGKELEIVRDLAEKGSPNHQILLQLHEHGASIMGTESADLIEEEYAVNKKIFASADLYQMTKLSLMHKTASDLLLEKRDAFIASRIDRTLLPGETGILFLGMLHNVAGRLPADMEILYPITPRPRERELMHG